MKTKSIDLEKRRLRLDSRTYKWGWDDSDHKVWRRIKDDGNRPRVKNSKRIKKLNDLLESSDSAMDLKKKRLYHQGEEYAFNSYTDDLTPCTWVRIKQRGTNGTSEQVTNQFEMEKLDVVLLRTAVLEHENGRRTLGVIDPPDSDEDGDKDEEEETEHTKPWQKHIQGPPAKGKRIERTKYGIRVYSCDRKTYWDFLVNKSTKETGSAAVRVTLPPARRDGKRWHMAVFDLEAMEAIRREFARGPQPRK